MPPRTYLACNYRNGYVNIEIDMHLLKVIVHTIQNFSTTFLRIHRITQLTYAQTRKGREKHFQKIIKLLLPFKK